MFLVVKHCENQEKTKESTGEPIAAHTDYLSEDVGKCLIAQGVLPVRTLDSSGKETLMALPLAESFEHN